MAVLVSLAVAVGLGFRAGGYLLAGSMALAAALRGSLPENYAGGLVVRRRFWDVVMYLLMAIAVATMFYIVKLPS
ncbi:hypothetical protein GCM10027579_00950 [Calidifontibacter terrae]